VIYATHNSSVAVAADSDRLIVLKAGAIDRMEVRQAVIEHLGCGAEPYKLRARKYNIA
jgi:hypothetical protein